MSQEFIKIRGARVHNLKNISLDIPKNKLIVITGLSGSGKSSLAFDTIYAEGQRRYVESLSAYARQFLGVMDKPDVDRIDGLSPAIAIDQKSVSKNPRSTVGTITEIYDYLRLLFARIGKPYCPKCNKVISRQSASQIVDQILKLPSREQILILGPVVRGKKGEHQGILEQVQKAGFVRVRIDGIVHYSQEARDLNLDKQKKHNIEIVVDQVEVPEKNNKDERARIVDSVETALKAGKGIVIVSKCSSDQVTKNSAVKSSSDQVIKKSPTQSLNHSITRSLNNDLLFSELFACDECGLSLPEIEPRLFSFNSPFGACPDCQGLGTKLEIDPKLVIPNDRLTVAEGAIRPWANASHRVGPLRPGFSEARRQGYYSWKLSQVAQEYNFSLNEPVKNLPSKIIDILLYGKGSFEGVVSNLERRWKETESEFSRAEIEKYMLIKRCPSCAGRKLKPEALAIRINSSHPRKGAWPPRRKAALRPRRSTRGFTPNPLLRKERENLPLLKGEEKRGLNQEINGGVNIAEISAMSIKDVRKYFETLNLNETETEISKLISKEILKRLKFLADVGLEYLTIGRESTTLSGGEAQRIRLATQIGSGLSGVVYILDEPSIGLHQRDLNKLIETLKQLRDLGNTVIVVEHDQQTILAADWVIDIGPGAGAHGGRVIFAGTSKQLISSKTLTGDYLSGRKKVEINVKKSQIPRFATAPARRAIFNDQKNPKSQIQNSKQNYIEIIGAKEHNLKNIDVKIPLGKLVAVTGVSGSGKSSLVNDILGLALARDFHGAQTLPGEHKEILGTNNLDKVIIIDQSPIGRTPRSNPATYTGIFTPVRDLFAATQEAKIRGFDIGRFSFNVKGGRCEACQGDGLKKIEMYFLPDVYIECEECHGQRYNKDVLEIEYKGKNIAEILAMSVDEARDFFKNIPAVQQKLVTLKEVGLSYIKLGQPSTTLSGGEAQRIKLATELARRDTGRTLYILDEPTTGLHFDDIKKLLNVLAQLVARGNSVLIIEHSLDVIKNADWIIDLGPEGGDKGGYLLTEGTVNDIKKNKKSYTGKYLKN